MIKLFLLGLMCWEAFWFFKWANSTIENTYMKLGLLLMLRLSERLRLAIFFIFLLLYIAGI